MKLDLYREPTEGGCTFGKLFVDGSYECETLEDAVREKKVSGETAIPAGTYYLEITYSPRFKKDLPLLADVPNFSGVRIHSGNTIADTEGCILVGQNRNGRAITSSRMAFDNLFKKLDAALGSADVVTIEIHS